MNTLPLSVRLRRAFFIALILAVWAPFKIAWEQSIERQQDLLRYRGITVTPQLRDQLGQGMTIGLLSGMRSIVADLEWLNLEVAWEHQQWFRMGGIINLCTSLQPRSITFWDIGGWQLAWNASVDAYWDVNDHDPLRRLKFSRFWIQKGLDIYLRGLAVNPERYLLWSHTGLLYQMRLKDYKMAAYYYDQARQRSDAPVYLERFPAIMLQKAGDDQGAYEAWQALWHRLTPQEKTMKEHWPSHPTLLEIRRLEDKLSIPKEKRVFPN